MPERTSLSLPASNHNQPNTNMKIAIYIEGGLIQAVRSDVHPPELEIEIVDKDNEPETAEDRWEELQGELKFGNY